MTSSPERALWKTLRRAWAGAHLVRIEDRYSAGIPDVSLAADGVEAWIELKCLRSWPARPTTPVRVGLKPVQSAWLRQRGAAGTGKAFVLVRIGRDYLLFHWEQADELTRPVAQHRILRMARGVWKRAPKLDELLLAIRGETEGGDDGEGQDTR